MIFYEVSWFHPVRRQSMQGADMFVAPVQSRSSVHFALGLPFLRSTAECFARLSHRLGVCPSVCLCPSVTLVICIKTVQARITKSSLWAAPRSLVYRDKISCHWVQGFPSNQGVKEGYHLKRRHFAVIGSNNVKTVADRYIHAAYHNKHWWQAF